MINVEEIVSAKREKVLKILKIIEEVWKELGFTGKKEKLAKLIKRYAQVLRC